MILAALLPLVLPALPTPQEDAEVRLIVLVSVDQMIPEQLERLAPWFTGGFARFAAGEVHHRAAHAHAMTATGPGHATLGTGVHPARSGIVGNSWNDRLAGNESVYCVADPTVMPLTSDGPEEPSGEGRSPATLFVDGLASYVRAASPKAKAIGVSGKDRAAILSTGPNAEWALWWDRSTGGGFQSSTYYGDVLPDWVLDWNARWWEGLSGFAYQDRLPADIARAGTAPDGRPGEPAQGFPHLAPVTWPAGETPSRTARTGLARWAYGSPLVDRFVVDLSKRAVVEHELGADEHVDYLFVGLSACDTVGHGYGPYSREVTQLLLDADAELETLFALLDERVGENRWIAALSSDHGVLTLPEKLAEEAFDAKRLPPDTYGRIAAGIGAELEAVFGANYVVGVGQTGLLFDEARMLEAGLDPEEVYAVASTFGLQEFERLERLVSGPELRAAEGTRDPLLATAARSYHPDRSSDLLLIFQPWTLVAAGTGTSHGTPWPYDREVPLAFLGPGSKPGSSHAPCWTVDVAPTLLSRAGLAVPEGLDGRVLR